jgi:hypothetical protein
MLYRLPNRSRLSSVLVHPNGWVARALGVCYGAFCSTTPCVLKPAGLSVCSIDDSLKSPNGTDGLAHVIDEGRPTGVITRHSCSTGLDLKCHPCTDHSHSALLEPRQQDPERRLPLVYTSPGGGHGSERHTNVLRVSVRFERVR